MSDVYELVIEQNDIELVSDDALELVLSDDTGVELVFDLENQLEVVLSDDSFELLLDSEPGIPAGGLVGQVLAKKSSTSFDVEWIPNVKITVGLTAPTSPAIGDLWVDTN